MTRSKIFRALVQTLVIFILFTLFPVNSVSAAVAKPGSVPAPPASTLNIKDQFVINPRFGNSDFMTNYQQAIVVTPGKSEQTGSIWSKNKIDLNRSFTYNTWHYLGDKQGSVADGMAFVLQNDSRGQSAYGSKAGGLGVYPYGWINKGKIDTNYIQNALAIEMDDWWNNITGKADDLFDADIPSTTVNPSLVGHIAVVQPRLVSSNNSKDLKHLQYLLGNLSFPLANNKWRKFSVSWMPKVIYTNGIRVLGGDLTYTFGEQVNGQGTYPTQTFHVDNVQTYFKTDHVYFGYTGATGAYPTFQAVSVDKLPQTAAPVTLNFVEKGTNTVLTTPVTLNGELGEAWDGSTRRQDWIQVSGVWYHYTGEYTTTPTGQLDKGTFDATTRTITYLYEKKVPPENYVLTKQVKNMTTPDPNYATTTTANVGDVVSYEMTYTNLTGISKGQIKDTLDARHDYVKNSLQIASLDTNGQFVTLADDGFVSNNLINFPYDILSGQSFKVRFQATVNDKLTTTTNPQSIPNQATVIPTTGTSINSNATTINRLMSMPVEVNFLEDGTNAVLADQQKLTGKIGAAWNAATDRPEWIQKDGNLYHYIEKFDADTADQKDQGTFSGSKTYHVNYYYQKIDEPEKLVLTKELKNEKETDAPWTTTTTAGVGDTIDYQLTYKNMTGISTGKLSDLLDIRHDYVAGSLQVSGPSDNGTFRDYDDTEFQADQTISFPEAIKLGDQFQIRFKATVNDKTAPENAPATIDNQATIKPATGDEITSDITSITRQSLSGKIIFRYVDRQSEMSDPTTVASEATVEGPVGTPVSELSAEIYRPKTVPGWAVVDYTTDGDLTQATYSQAEKYNPAITADTQIITYRYERAMIGLSTEKTWNFGTFPAQNIDKTYNLPAGKSETGESIPHGITIADYYGIDGWTLNVQQEDQFKSEADPTNADANLQVAHELTDAQLNFKNGTFKSTTSLTTDDDLDPSFPIDADTSGATTNDTGVVLKDAFSLTPKAEATSILTMPKVGHYFDAIENGVADPENTKYDNSGYHIWRYEFGENATASQSIGLHVPATTKRYKTEYKSVLTWSLILAPGGE